MQISFRLKGGVRREAETDLYVSYCPTLNIYSQGATQELAKTALVDAINLYIASLYDRKLYAKLLAPRGFIEADQAPTDDSEYEARLDIATFISVTNSLT